MEKRYYWLRLHDDFFESKRIKKLRRMAGGDTFTIIYLKMQLLAMKTDGILKWTGLEDNFAEELALDLDEKPENVAVTVAYLLNTGLAETDDNVNFFLPYAVSNTGSESSSAKRVREHRERKLQGDSKALHCNTGVTQVSQNCNGEKEIEKEIETEIDIEKEVRHRYGEAQNVLLTDAEYKKLQERFPDYQDRIDELSCYIGQKHKHYDSHYLAILSWARKEAKEDAKRKKEGRLDWIDELSGVDDIS